MLELASSRDFDVIFVFCTDSSQRRWDAIQQNSIESNVITLPVARRERERERETDRQRQRQIERQRDIAFC